jgi:hypothetical protein
MAIKDSEFTTADALWFFYFLKVAKSSEEENLCKSLLVFVDIKSMEQEKKQLRTDLLMLLENSKKEVARKLKMSPTLIIPVENIITIEDMEEKLREKDEKLKEKDKKIKEKDSIIENQLKEIERLKKESKK